jgi:hypothetical protein
MSFSVSGVGSGSSYDALDAAASAKAPIIKPTATQQIHTLASSGQSASVIASTVGVPVSQVDADLGITSSGSSDATSQASALVALAGRLSVHA